MKQLPPKFDNADHSKNPFFEYIHYTECKRLLELIGSALAKDKAKTLAVLSELPGEGKSFFVSALGLGFSMLLNRRVLVVNTVKQPRNGALYFQTYFQASGSHFGQQGKVDVISPLETEDEGGRLDAGSDFRIGAYVDTIRADYDLILFDTCAMSAANMKNMDPVVIARQVERSVLISSPRSLKKEVIASAKGRLQQWDIRLLGNIYNAGVRDD